jgi:cation-transporting ATPase E
MLTGESDYIPKQADDTILSGSFAVAGEGVYRAATIGAACWMQKVVEEGRRLEQKKTPVERKVNLLSTPSSDFASCGGDPLTSSTLHRDAGRQSPPIRNIVAASPP